MRAFMEHCARATGRRFHDPVAFHRFSVDEYRTFWRLFLDWAAVRYDGSPDLVCTDDRVEQAVFFPHLRLNYAETLLSPAAGPDDTATAIVSCNEAGETRTLSRGELRARVGSLRQALDRLGVGPGAVVAALVRNRAETVIACLASTGQGALWSSLSPDLAPTPCSADSASSSRPSYSSMRPTSITAPRRA